MNNFASEFQDVFQLYLKLGEELEKLMDVKDSKDSQALVRFILQNRDCLVRVEQMNSRVRQLSDDWRKCRDKLDPKSRNEARNLAEAARAQAVRLKNLCTIQAQKLETARDKLGKGLAEIGKGTRFLKSIKPIKNNYPKFIDSLY
jgi:hypothetical protein